MKNHVHVGNYAIEFTPSHGARVNLATTNQVINWRSRQRSVALSPDELASNPSHSTAPLTPPQENNLVNYAEIIQQAVATLTTDKIVEIITPFSLSKRILQYYLLQESIFMRAFPDGIIALPPGLGSVSDMLQVLLESFYTLDIPYKATDKEIFPKIQGKQALIILDKQEIGEWEISELIAVISQCKFILVSTGKIGKIGTTRKTLNYSCLPLADALTVVESELQRPLTTAEIPAAKSLCELCQRNPTYLRIAIATMVTEGWTLAELVSQLPNSATDKYLIRHIFTSLSGLSRTVLEILIVMGKVGITPEQAITLTKQLAAGKILSELHQRHLVELDGEVYRLHPETLEFLPLPWELADTLELINRYFTHWSEKYAQKPEILSPQITAIAQIIEVNVRASHWQEVLSLVSSIDTAIALNRYWGLWEHILTRGLQASQAVQNQTVEAWVLHQLGTRALCLGDKDTATKYLNQAQQIREHLGEASAIATTTHNLQFLEPPKVAPHTPEPPPTHNPINPPAKPATSPELLTRLNITIDDSPGKEQPVKQNSPIATIALISAGLITSAAAIAGFNWQKLTKQQTAPTNIQPQQQSQETKQTTPTVVTPKKVNTPVPAKIPSPTVSPDNAAPPPMMPPIEVEFDNLPKQQVQIQRPRIPRRQRVVTPKPQPTAVPTPTEATPETTTTPTPEATTQPTETPQTFSPI
ncbi:hypothetical protein [Calothrix sp. 336/3]|uniref:hypothetical protein n=1 Tax=Calothrix sp. 336/3 TaxID=1337936 RepID=UPI0004E45D73|nr:hypothetical protein [Calothrix sp. 336/3]AKG23569.1 hypothetical protein IJ00_21835 [Calothrix sp. 336/3]